MSLVPLEDSEPWPSHFFPSWLPGLQNLSNLQQIQSFHKPKIQLFKDHEKILYADSFHNSALHQEIG
ncbi:hypothetical protein M407DRAFT_29144 [Tulasnella calospora MUT 4182]|uniref:Uncharacterized protein n=1 Tax=Tulasnella calospora MUT 4182 TaxID=1051891 RepID=A0A0C3KI89_9AGAM|nr:hypothetical protein M407DRAFT_29144 [Tulasnella calospora MUT 4182]